MSENRRLHRRVALTAAFALLCAGRVCAQAFISSNSISGLKLYDRGGAGTNFWLDPSGGKLRILANSVEVASITSTGWLYIQKVLGDGSALTGVTGSEANTYASSKTFTGALGVAGNVGIGTTAPAGKLDVRDGRLVLTDADVAHGMTGYGDTSMFGRMEPMSAVDGGLWLTGFSDADATGLHIGGVMGSADPDDAIPAIRFNATKKNGANDQALGPLETAFQFYSYTNHLATILGSGNVGIGMTSPLTKLDVNNAATYAAMRLIGNSNYPVANIQFIDNSGSGGGMEMGSDYNGIYFVRNDNTNGGSNYGGAQIMFLQRTSGNVGIGTSVPAAELHVSSPNAPAAAALFLVSSGTAAGQELLVVKGDGKVGIGTTSPTNALDIAVNPPTSGLSSRLTLSNMNNAVNTGGGLLIQALDSASNPTFYGGFSSAIMDATDGSEDGRINIREMVAGTLTNVMTFSSGSVGIGTISPDDKLEIYGGAANSAIRLSNTATSNDFVRANISGNLELGTFYGHALGLFTSNNERVHIDSTGNVGIGTTSPAAELHVSSVSATASATPFLVSSGTAAGQELLIVKGDGKVGIGAASPGAKLDVNGDLSVRGGQILFPATQAASSNANTLDDYEEGTWTPVLGGGGGQSGQTYATQSGHYVKIGKFVLATFTINMTAKGTITGNVQISGLPFSSDGINEAGTCHFGRISGFIAAVSLGGVITSSNNIIDLWGRTASSDTDSQFATASLGSTPYIHGACSYIAAN